MLQVPILECLSFDPFSSFDNGRSPAEVGIGRRHVVEALVMALIIVMLDEGLDLLLKITGQEVVLQQDAILQGLMPALDLALSLRMERRTAHVAHPVGLDVFGQFACDVARAIITEQARPVQHVGMVAA